MNPLIIYDSGLFTEVNPDKGTETKGGEKMRDLRSYYVFNIICGNAKEDDDNDWYDCDGFGSY